VGLGGDEARRSEPVQRLRPGEIGLDLRARQKSDPVREAHRRINRKDRIRPQGLDYGLTRGKELSRDKSALPLEAQRDDSHHAVPDRTGHLADEPFPP
jgi:hypothetical protein